MPLYEYQCPKCEHAVEILVRSVEESISCPDCGNKQLTRLMSAPSAPNVRGQNGTRGQNGSLPMASSGESCGAPRCCGGICQ